MINNAYNKGREAALVRFKLAQGMGGMGGMSGMGGTSGTNPTTGGMAAMGAMPRVNTGMAPPTSSAAPMAAGSQKAQALG